LSNFLFEGTSPHERRPIVSEHIYRYKSTFDASTDSHATDQIYSVI